MELSVYISNERIEIVAGTGSKSKAKIKKVYSLEWYRVDKHG